MQLFRIPGAVLMTPPFPMNQLMSLEIPFPLVPALVGRQQPRYSTSATGEPTSTGAK